MRCAQNLPTLLNEHTIPLYQDVVVRLQSDQSQLSVQVNVAFLVIDCSITFRIAASGFFVNVNCGEIINENELVYDPAKKLNNNNNKVYLISLDIIWLTVFGITC